MATTPPQPRAASGECEERGTRVTWRQRAERNWAVVLTLVVLAVPLVGVISGDRTLFFRDVSNLHLPAKWSQAESWRAGQVPVLDLQRAGGQPSLGNPNLLPLYPDNLLYLFSPTLWAFNAHYWLHLLLAPFAGAWLGRQLGLGRRPAWAMGTFYATSGFFLSQLNFYNLVAVCALLPALLAALLAAGRTTSGAASLLPRLALVSLISGLLLLAGDPMLAVLGLAVGALLLIVERCSWRRLTLLGAAVFVGVLLGLPQHVEFLRILPESYRAYIGYSAQGALVGSWDPRQMVEWFVPFAFGRPDQTFWGAQFFGGVQPFLFSLYPGILLIGCLLLSGLPSRPDRWRWLAWLGIALGLFVALGSHNPLLRGLVTVAVEWFGAVLRFPVKFWVLVALGSAYLAAVGWQRAFVERSAPKANDSLRPRSWWIFAALAAAQLVVLLSLRVGLLSGPIEASSAAVRISSEVIVEQWEQGLTWGACAALFFALASWMARRRSTSGSWPEIALVAHVTVQVVVLSPLLVSDAAAVYAEPSPLVHAMRQADELYAREAGDRALDAPVDEPGAAADRAVFSEAPETLVQGNQFGAFGPPGPNVRYPDARALWVQRRGAAELFPFVGVRWGLHYETNVAADGLDHFASHLSLTALRGLSDEQRVKLLRAWSVDWLILDRQLESVPSRFARRIASLEHFEFTTSLYRLGHSAPPALVATEIESGNTVGEVRAALLSEDFDPRRAVVLLGVPEEEVDTRYRASRSAPGRVLSYQELDDAAATVRLEVEAAHRSVVQLARAYQPHYGAWVDGQRQATVISNLSRLAVIVEPGRHVVEFRVTRARQALWWGIALVAWLLCSSVVVRSAGRQLLGPREESTGS